ncbi:unnamed protein product, partial [Prunus brigantina]
LEHFHPKASFGSRDRFEGKSLPMSFPNGWKMEIHFTYFRKHIILSMSNLRRVLERQQREDEEIRRKCAKDDRELNEEEEEVVLAVGMLNQSRQQHHGCAPNVDRHRHSQTCLFGSCRSQNDLNVLGQSLVFNDVLREGYRKDVERCFGILQARWAIIKGAARMFDEKVFRSIMMTCIILHNMIVEDEYDNDAPKMFEPDPMNTVLTRIYEWSMGANGQPLEHEPLIRDGQ